MNGLLITFTVLLFQATAVPYRNFAYLCHIQKGYICIFYFRAVHLSIITYFVLQFYSVACEFMIWDYVLVLRLFHGFCNSSIIYSSNAICEKHDKCLGGV